jgi:hypothetical protein
MLILSFRLGMSMEVRRRQAGQVREGKFRYSLNRLFWFSCRAGPLCLGPRFRQPSLKLNAVPDPAKPPAGTRTTRTEHVGQPPSAVKQPAAGHRLLPFSPRRTLRGAGGTE